MASQVALVVKNLLANARDIRDVCLIPRKIPWRRVWPLTPIFFPGESHGQRSLAGYGPKGHKDLDMSKMTWHACIKQSGSGDLKIKTRNS